MIRLGGWGLFGDDVSCFVSIAESLERFRAVVDAAKVKDVKVRGYVSCALGEDF